MEQTQAKFEGWAVVELFGHNREIGFISTEYFGDRAMFRVDVPELPEREWELERPDIASGRYVPKGTKVKRSLSPARSRLISPGAVYALNPCTEAVALKEIERQTAPPLILVALPPEVALPPKREDIGPGAEYDDEGNLIQDDDDAGDDYEEER